MDWCEVVVPSTYFTVDIDIIKNEYSIRNRQNINGFYSSCLQYCFQQQPNESMF